MFTPWELKFSISDVVVQAKQVYGAFHDEFDSTPNRILELAETINHLHDVLDNVRKVMEWYGLFFPEESSFCRRLEECEAFIGRHSELEPAELVSVERDDRSRRMRRVWQTTRYAFDNDAVQLNHDLILELRKLNTFIVVLAWTHTLPASMVSVLERTSTGSQHDGSANPRGDRFFLLFNDLLKLKCSYERERSLAQQLNRKVDFNHTYRQLEHLWRQLCDMAGLSGELAAVLSPQALLDFPQKLWNDAVLNLSAPSMVYMNWNEDRRLEQSSSIIASAPRLDIQTNEPPVSPFTREFRWSGFNDSNVSSPPSLLTTIPPFPSPSLHPKSRHWSEASFLLPPPALPVHKATITLHPKAVCLYSWRFFGTPSHRKLVWIRIQPNATLEHHLPREAIPYTMHSSQNKPLCVSFHESHQLIFRRSESVEATTTLPVIYTFIQPRDVKSFQEDLRNMNLLGTYDFTKITSAQTDRFCGEATNEVVKLWRSREYPHAFSLSFYASSVEKQHLEFHIPWFERQVTVRRTSHMRLDFARERGHSSFLRRFSCAKSTHSGSPSTDSTSMVTGSTQRPAIGELPSGAITEKLKYLDIHFSNDHVREEFIRTLEAIWKEIDRINPTFELSAAHACVELPAVSSPTELPVEQT